MTTYVNFAPSNNSAPPFSCQVTLDGQIYNLFAAWNLAAQRWYISITDQSNVPVVNRPLVASPAQTPLTGLSWANGVVTALTATRLGYAIGTLITVSIAGALPSALSGVFPCTITGANAFTYPLAADPGQVLAAGSWSTDVNLAGGFFNQSTLVFRAVSQNFEITP